MAEYCTQDDLLELRPSIEGYGVDSWEKQITEAGVLIDRTLLSTWYRPACKEKDINSYETTFDRDKLLNIETQLKRLAVFKALELIYFHLRLEGQSDHFNNEYEVFRDQYKVELKEVWRSGIDYDWDDDASIAASESYNRRVRRLVRV